MIALLMQYLFVINNTAKMTKKNLMFSATARVMLFKGQLIKAIKMKVNKCDT